MFKHRLSDEFIRSTYTHYGYHGRVVPIYFNENTHEVCIRNGWPEWLLDLSEALVFGLSSLATSINPFADPILPITITKRIDGSDDDAD